MAKKIILTGASGLIGKSILALLPSKDRDCEIYCLGRSKPFLTVENLNYIEADFTKDPKDILGQLPSDIHAVIHAAAYIGRADDVPGMDLYRKVNIDFTGELFNHLRKNGCSTVVFLSGFNFLKKPLLDIITEDHPVLPLTAYAQSKYEGENLLFHNAKNSFRPVVLRISSPVSLNYKDLHNTVLKRWITQAMAGNPIEVYGQGDRSQDFIATKDIAAAVFNALMMQNAEGVFNIAAGEMLTMRNLAGIISTYFNGIPINFSGEDPNGSECWNISIQRAKNELNFLPQDPQQTIEEVLRSTDAMRHNK